MGHSPDSRFDQARASYEFFLGLESPGARDLRSRWLRSGHARVRGLEPTDWEELLRQALVWPPA